MTPVVPIGEQRAFFSEDRDNARASSKESDKQWYQ